MEMSAELANVWVHAAPMLAQAGDNKGLIGAIILVIVALVVIGLVVSSRRAEPEVDEKPVAEAPDVDKPNLDVLENRKDASEFEGRDESEMSIAEIKELRRARQNTRRKNRRATAVEATAQAREEHENLSEATDDEEETPVEEETSSKETPSEEPVAEAKGDDPEEADDAFSFGGLDDGWADADSVLEDLDGDEEEAPVAAKEPEPAPEPVPEPAPAPDPAPEPEPVAAASQEEEETSVAVGLTKTRESGFGRSLRKLFQREELGDDLRDELEEFLYTSDIGAKAAEKIMDALQNEIDPQAKKDPAQVWDFARDYVEGMLKRLEKPLDITAHEPFVILVIGVNGAGKTTTIGKMASQFKRQGKSVMLVAGDTFRAAAVEQLEVWANRVDIPMHKGEPEADPASVVFSGIEKGVEEGFDVVICDTSGRLATKKNLMGELKKIERVSGKALAGAPHETILVLDANTGQNAVLQARKFGEALAITGLALTKLDGTARGGVILGIGEELGVPVRYIGIGEGINDLRPFGAEEFTEALFM